MEWNKKSWTDKEYKELQQKLNELSEEKYALFQKRIIKEEAYPILGVRMPILKKIAKEIVKGNEQQFLQTASAVSHEERLLLAIVIGESACQYDVFEARADDFVKKIDNWAVCDAFCTSIKKHIKRNKNAFWQHILCYLHSENHWIVRVGLVCMLSHYIEEEYLEEVLKRCDGVKNDFYYVKMAQAWLMATAFTKYPQRVKPYFTNHTLDTWTLHKAIQKVCQSQRVSLEEKGDLKTLKRV